MRNKTTVERMLYWAKKIEKYTEGKSPNELKENDMLAEACVFSLSQIGELSNKISKRFAERNPDIPWRALYGLRNKIVHEYDGLEETLIGEIIFEDIPRVKKALENL